MGPGEVYISEGTLPVTTLDLAYARQPSMRSSCEICNCAGGHTKEAAQTLQVRGVVQMLKPHTAPVEFRHDRRGKTPNPIQLRPSRTPLPFQFRLHRVHLNCNAKECIAPNLA